MAESDEQPDLSGRLNSKILTFEVEAEDYGIDINRVREIRGWSQVRSVPGAADFVLGILRLRGAVIPIVDLRSRLGLGESVCDHRTVIVIVALGGDQGVNNVGLVVDSVSDVVDLGRGRLLSSPELGTPAQKALVTEVALVDERMYLLVDLDRIFDQKQLAALETVVAPG
ncbi:MAG: chemotaxis protein CheW [Wenzhouxiangella sp.]|jgi:purine-binding chemotaxis protein CheW|nr:chemotaxis protein CheW [Wenzhouxiangella sp.]